MTHVTKTDGNVPRIPLDGIMRFALAGLAAGGLGVAACASSVEAPDEVPIIVDSKLAIQGPERCFCQPDHPEGGLAISGCSSYEDCTKCCEANNLGGHGS
jgi:hypothetical protein